MKFPNHVKIQKIPNKGKGLVSTKIIKKNSIVLQFDEGVTIRPNSKASKTAIQIDEDSFLDSNPKQIRDFLNHSCDPTVRIDFNKMACIAIKNIYKKDEITFHYSTTEYDLKIKKEDFRCFCGTKNCIGQVKGFKYLSQSQKQKIKNLLTPYLLRKMK